MDRIVRSKDCIALLETNGGYKIAIVTPGGYRRDYPKVYKRYKNAENAWYAKLGEVHGICVPH